MHLYVCYRWMCSQPITNASLRPSVDQIRWRHLHELAFGRWIGARNHRFEEFNMATNRPTLRCIEFMWCVVSVEKYAILCVHNFRRHGTREWTFAAQIATSHTRKCILMLMSLPFSVCDSIFSEKLSDFCSAQSICATGVDFSVEFNMLI